MILKVGCATICNCFASFLRSSFSLYTTRGCSCFFSFFEKWEDVLTDPLQPAVWLFRLGPDLFFTKRITAGLEGPYTFPCLGSPRELSGRAETSARSVWAFSTTSPGEGKRAASSRYKRSAPCDVVPYLPGRGRRAIMKARGLGQWPSLHLEGALAYHLPKWESGRHNLW